MVRHYQAGNPVCRLKEDLITYNQRGSQYEQLTEAVLLRGSWAIVVLLGYRCQTRNSQQPQRV